MPETPKVKLLYVVPVTVAELVLPYTTVLPVMVKVFDPDKVRAVPVPVRVKVSEEISKFWDESTVIEVHLTEELVDKVVAVLFAETWTAPISCFVALLSVQVFVGVELPDAKIIVPLPLVTVVALPIDKAPRNVKLALAAGRVIVIVCPLPKVRSLSTYNEPPFRVVVAV